MGKKKKLQFKSNILIQPRLVLEILLFIFFFLMHLLYLISVTEQDKHNSSLFGFSLYHLQ